MKYLVTGASGNFGGAALKHLSSLVEQNEIVALVRNEAKVANLEAAGYEVRVADYGNEAALKTAFAGIDRVLLISGAPGNRQAEHKNVIEAAKSAGVTYLVYTSFPKAPDAENALAPDHAVTEKMIIASGLEHAFLRNNWYLENELPLVKAALHSGTLAFAAGEGRVGWALRREYAEAAVNILVNKSETDVLEFGGTPRTYVELTEALVAATGKQVLAKSVDDAEFVASLVNAGMNEATANVFLSFQKLIEDRQLDVPSDDLTKTLGHPLASLTEAFKELI
ncbi:SDR family oxidoreductase [Weissella muntiaci]|uniref:SDR family oxidoreductase n=1 Tax=Weissella muntiaci TaxID=2508881 RepID=A0A6C2C871_9LACO|nr:SDR family oxidoreductase [Weissella muntiaci]TYC50087.1 SDR family oxidoreductase [Weissella muntiaci]